MSLFKELKRREIFQVAAVYVAVAWGLTEILVEVVDRLELPPEIATIAVIVFVLGFPVAMFLTWVFDITPQGIRRTEPSAARGTLSVAFAVVFLIAGSAGLFYFLDSRATFTREDALILPYRSIAVLPFEAADAQQASATLAIGLVDEILAKLSYVPDLKVIARASSFSEELHGLDAREIGQRLGVRKLLQGSLLRSGPQLRVNLALVDVVSGVQTWADTLDTSYENVFSVPGELAGRVINALELDISDETMAHVTYTRPTNAQAYDLYLLAEQRIRDMIDDNTLLAVRYYEEALTIDPDFAKAHAGLAVALPAASLFLFIPPEDVIGRARESALRAIALDDTLNDGHLALGVLAFGHEWNWTLAGREFRRAVSLAPGDVDALAQYAYFLSSTGEHDSAIETMRRIAELDPLTADWQMQIGWLLNAASRFEDALAQFEYVAQLMPDNPTVQMFTGVVLLQLARREEALTAVDRSLALAPEDLLLTGGNAWTLALAGERQRALELLEQYHVMATTAGYADPIADAVVYAALGDSQRALGYVEQMISDRAGSVMFLTHGWEFDALRDEPRFQTLIEQAGLAQWTKTE